MPWAMTSFTTPGWPQILRSLLFSYPRWAMRLVCAARFYVCKHNSAHPITTLHLTWCFSNPNWSFGNPVLCTVYSTFWTRMPLTLYFFHLHAVNSFYCYQLLVYFAHFTILQFFYSFFDPKLLIQLVDLLPHGAGVMKDNMVAGTN